MLKLHIVETEDTITIPKKEFQKLLKNQKNKIFEPADLINLDRKKFSGILKWNNDGLECQKKIRNEWE